MKCHVCGANCRKQYEILNNNKVIELVPACEVHSPKKLTNLLKYKEERKTRYNTDPEYRQRRLEIARASYAKVHSAMMCHHCNNRCTKVEKDGSPICSKCSKKYNVATFKKNENSL